MPLYNHELLSTYQPTVALRSLGQKTQNRFAVPTTLNRTVLVSRASLIVRSSCMFDCFRPEMNKVTGKVQQKIEFDAADMTEFEFKLNG